MGIQPNVIVERALVLWRRGLNVFPVPQPDGRHDGKTPVIEWGEYQDRRQTEDEVRGWFRTPQNIAIITGAISGVVVIDADTPEAVRWVTSKLPYTPWQTKTARGFHLWYRHPGVRIATRARVKTNDGRQTLDIRGDGGLAIAPGSVHLSGVVYAEAGDWTVERDRLPAFWRGWLHQAPRVAPAAPAPRPTGEVVDRARRYLARIPPPEIGHGSDAATLYAACRVVRGFDVPEHEAIELLFEWAGGRPGWTREWIASKAQAATKYGTEPIGALR